MWSENLARHPCQLLMRPDCLTLPTHTRLQHRLSGASHGCLCTKYTPDGLSIKDHIGPESVTLRYTTINEAVKISQQLGRGTFLAKIDLKRAFRRCPVWLEDWHLLVLHWKWQFYFDKCLPFGLHSSPFLFDTLASVLEYIFKHYIHNPHIIHCLDDFLIACPPHSSTHLTTFTAIKELWE